MKKIFALVILFVAIVATTACVTVTPAPTPTQSNMTIVEVGSFYTYSQVVKKGDTAWDIAQVYYGSGFDWKRIVELNPFLQDPLRIKRMGDKIILYIYPGEKLRLTPDIEKVIIIGTTTNPEQLPSTSATTVPWWGWLLIAIWGIIFIFFLVGTVGLTTFHRCYRPLPCPCPATCPPVPDPAMPSVSYNSSANGERRARIEGARETVITHSATGEMTVTARQ